MEGLEDDLGEGEGGEGGEAGGGKSCEVYTMVSLGKKEKVKKEVEEKSELEVGVEEEESGSLLLELFEKDTFSSRFLGNVFVPLSSLPKEAFFTRWFLLHDRSPSLSSPLPSLFSSPRNSRYSSNSNSNSFSNSSSPFNSFVSMLSPRFTKRRKSTSSTTEQITSSKLPLSARRASGAPYKKKSVDSSLSSSLSPPNLLLPNSFGPPSSQVSNEVPNGMSKESVNSRVKFSTPPPSPPSPPSPPPPPPHRSQSLSKA